MKIRRVPLPKPDPGAQFRPEDFNDLLEHLPATCILIGGQAIAWWAEKYSVKTQGGTLLNPTSKDIDFWGTNEDLVHIASHLKKTPNRPDKREMTTFIGAIEVNASGKKTALELLRRVPGLDSDDPNVVALPEAITKSGKMILVLTPVSLVLSKLYNLRHFPQEGRHDLMHLQTSLIASRYFISEIVSREPRLALWNCKRIIRAHQEKPNQRLERQQGFHLLSGIPIENIRTASQDKATAPENRLKLQGFLERQWPRVSGEAKDSPDDLPPNPARLHT